MRTNSKLKLAVATAVTAIMSGNAVAESTTDTASAWSAAVNHDFSIVIPGFLFFRVGTDAATIDQITFTATTANVGNSTPIAGTGGEAGGGSAATVVVRANVGQITITEANNSGGNGLGTGTVADGFIPYSEITTTSSDIPNLPAPTLSNAGGNTALPALNSNKTTNRTATWTFAYANTTVPTAGTYGAGGGTGGRVTYTATAP